jgi:glycosyltransferase involved in cell wall biosynthesis
MLISVIVTTHDRPDALVAVLQSLAHQTDDAFEIVIAEDGIDSETETVMKTWKARLSRPLLHIRQEHDGFRAAEIRNRAILAAHGAYCIFLDGDCLVRPDFVAVHRQLAEAGWFVTGNRVLLSPDFTAQILRDGLSPERWSLPAWIAARAGGKVNRLAALLHIPLGPLRRLRPRAWRDARSCNLGVWREDLARADGFDGIYRGWGREDSDLLVRLLRAGVRRKDGWFATGVLHLWHPAADRAGMEENDRRLQAVIQGNNIRAQQGLSSLSGADSKAATA